MIKQKITKSYMSKNCAKGYEFYECSFSELGNLLEANAAYSNFRFKGGVRGKDNILNGTSFVILDIDTSVITDEECHLLLEGINHFIVRTSDKNNAYKFRVLIQLDSVVDLDSRIWVQFVQEVGNYLGLTPDRLSKSHIYFAYEGREVMYELDGEPLDTRDLILKATENTTKKVVTKPLSTTQQKALLNDRFTTFTRAYECSDGSGSIELYTAVLYAKDLGADYNYVCDLLDSISSYWISPFPEDRLNALKEQVLRLF